MRIGACIGIGLIAVVLAGCASDVPRMPPPPSPSVTPLFASDDEALAAAEDAYAAYLAMSDEILIDGGTEPERLLEVATDNVYQDELEGYQLAQQRGWHSTGGTTFSNMSLQQYDDSGVTVYVCADVSAVDVLNADGESVVSAERPSRTAFEVEFTATESRLLVSSDSVWDGDGVCL